MVCVASRNFLLAQSYIESYMPIETTSTSISSIMNEYDENIEASHKKRQYNQRIRMYFKTFSIHYIRI